MPTLTRSGTLASLACAVTLATCIAGPVAAGDAANGVPPQQVADMLRAVIEANRLAYTVDVVDRLQNQERVIAADEHFRDKKLMPLPVQLFQLGAERVAARTESFSYSLRSLWPINKESGPRGAIEAAGLEAVADGQSASYAQETIEGTRYFTAIYPDVALFSGCVSCHNSHQDSPRRAFRLNDVMGALVIRLRVD